MRILYHHRTKSRDGQYVHIAELQAALRRAGHEVVEVAPDSGGEKPGFGGESRRLARIARLVPESLHQVLEWGYNAVSYRKLKRAIRTARPDFIYERYALGNLAGARAARKFGLPLMLEVNAPLAEERHRFGKLAFPRFAQRQETRLLRRADRVIAVTGVLREMLVAAGAPADRVVVIPNGIDPRRFAGAPDTETAKAALGLAGRPVLGFTGFCRDWHGLDRVVRLLAGKDGLPDRTHFLVVGDGPACPGLRALASELDVAGRLTITGIVERDAIPRHVAAFDVALQPDVTPYASPLKLFEYLALGKAVAAPDRANIREVVSHGESALLFDPEDPAGLGRAARRLLEDEELRGRIGNRARALIDERRYTWDANAERVVELARNRTV